MKKSLLLFGALCMGLSSVYAADGITVAPATGAEISAAITAAKGDAETVGDITINLDKDGNYTLTGSIETAAGLVINGNGATIDASALEAPFILMSKTPAVDVINNYYRVGAVTISNVTVKGIKNSIFYDNNTKYCVVDFTIDNSTLALATTAVENQALISFKAGGIKDFTIKNSTVYGNGEVANYFIRYENGARIDRYGYDEADTWSMVYTNNTFYKAIMNSGQWGNYNGVSGKPKAMIVTVNKNIWYDCSEQVLRRMFQSKSFKDFNAASSVAENTFWYNDAAADQGSYGDGLELITNPGFKDPAEGNFTIGAGTQQAKYQTGAPEWLVEYDKEIAVPIAVTASPATGEEISAAIAKAVESVDKAGNITVNLAKDGNYTLTGSIETAAGLVINGNGATIDASALEAPFILMSKTPAVDVINNYYRVGAVTISNVTVKGIKNSIFYDNNTKYCVVDFTIDNSTLALATTAVENQALISFKAGGIKDFTIKNSTVYGNGEVANYFIRYENGARIDRYGYDEADTWSMVYTNNTFYKAIMNNGQWGNYNGVSGKPKAMIVTVNKNIWYDCSEQVLRRMFQSKFFKDFNAASSVAENTFWYNDAAADQGSYGDGLELTTNPKFKDAAEGDFTIGAGTQQAKYQTGAPEWLVEFDPAQSAIETIGSDDESAPVEYYNLQGVRVENPTEGLFIRKQGNKVTKVIVK